MSEYQGLQVIVIGAGPGGLLLAQGLKKHGIGVAVYERDAARTDYLQGFRLQIRSRGIDALKACLPDALYQSFASTYAAAPGEYALLSEQLEQLPRRTPDPELEHSEREKSVSRITLRQVLLSGLDGVLHYQKTYDRYEERADGKVVAYFTDGSSVVGDVLVGADGANSRVRRQLVPHARWVDTGARRLAGKIALTDAVKRSVPELFYKKTVSVKSDSGYNLFFTSHEFRPGHEAIGVIGGEDTAALGEHGGLLFDNAKSYIMWALSGLREQLPPDDELFGYDGAQLRGFINQVVEQWHPAYRQLFDLSDTSTLGVLPIRTSLPVEPWPTRAVTLLGDAIHSMTYFRALGANTAMADAAFFLRQILAHRDGGKGLLDALHDYEAQMLEHGFEAVRKSIAAFEQGHAATSRHDWPDVRSAPGQSLWVQSNKTRQAA
ncbi:FAD-dependent oxidoreductase [Janthinobacterium agaricidamnosum]|uniref:FAD binding domain protein n=1 Tax=Janthinobacterium agaricidamnosum NBRC 102515 = DSM 9628 TaxID=1349767 RepID=W0V9C4_9BURK|nr:NAD(P)/FAD-dependent oxidoreductase [Janthinobacterium agaricidamnosum]CDG84461.1 FAD binding domain protein [Janthinobacterium agaricidamnosum NBRC 102515 = DSM 9628]